MSRRITLRQPLDLALSLEMGQAFRWRRVGDEKVRQGHWATRRARGEGTVGVGTPAC